MNHYTTNNNTGQLGGGAGDTAYAAAAAAGVPAAGIAGGGEMKPPPPRNHQEDALLLPTPIPRSNGETPPSVLWTSQTGVLEWIEKLALVAEEEPATSFPHQPPSDHQGHHRLHLQPITIDGIQLSEPSPPLPPSIAVEKSFEKRGSGVAGHDDRDDGDRCAGGTPQHWNSRFLVERDPFAWTYARQMDRLACQVEELLESAKPPPSDNGDGGNDKMADLFAAYRMVHTRLEFTFGRILGQFPCGTSTECGEVRDLLDTLYSDAIKKLRDLAVGEHPAKKAAAAALKQCPAPDAAASSGGGGSGGGGAPLNKKDLQKYMTTWLRGNWTNPYPDEDGLIEMARECGTSSTQVSNWLINARTRKWRPAIIKATQLNRPSSMLLEDSINIFDGKPVRDISHHRQQQQQQQQHEHEHEQEHGCGGDGSAGIQHELQDDDGPSARPRINKRLKFGN